MTIVRRTPCETRRRGALAAAALAPALVGCALAGCALTACAGAAARASLGARPTAVATALASPSAPSRAVLTARERVVRALIGYTGALGAADKSRNPAAARQLLRPYLVVSRISGLVLAMHAIWAKGEAFFGAEVLHVSRVTIHGDRAFVLACDDTSTMGLMSIATGQVIPGSAGARRTNLVTRLDLVSGRWLVEFQLVEDVPCTP